MHGHPHQITTRPAIVTAAVAFAASWLGSTPGAAQSPGASVPSAPAHAPSATSDLAAFVWSVTDGPFERARFTDLAVGAKGDVLAVGYQTIPSDEAGCCAPTPAIWHSDDQGRTWTQLDTSELQPSTELLSVVANGGIEGFDFLIAGLDDVGEQGELVVSDGSSIGTLEAPAEQLFGIDRSPTGLHTLGMSDAGSFVSTSTDGGGTWVPVPLSSTGIVRDLAVADDGTLVAIGWEPLGEDQNAPTAWSSTDAGAAWTATTLPVDPASWVVDDIESTPVGLLARVVDGSDDSSQEWLSHDGVSWQEVLQTSARAFPGTDGPEALLFEPGHLWHSLDGVRWEDLGARLDDYEISATGVLPDGLVLAAGTQSGADPSGMIFRGGPAAP